MGRVQRRLSRLEAEERVRAAMRDPSPPFVIVFPDGWPAEEVAAYDAAEKAGDWAARAAVVARNTGEAPGPRTRVIAIRERPDGPQ